MKLSHGKHNTREDGLCLMEAVAMLGGEGHTDTPECACPVFSAFGRKLNDKMGIGAEGDALRAKYLADLAPRLVGTRSTPEVEIRRALVFADGAVRVLAPLALEAAGLCDAAAADAAAYDAAAYAAAAYDAAAYAAAANAAANAAAYAYAVYAYAAYACAADAAAYAADAAAYAANAAHAANAANAAAYAAAYAAYAAAAPHRRDDPETGPADAWVEARALFIRAMEVSDE